MNVERNEIFDFEKEYSKMYTPCYVVDKEKFLENLYIIKNGFKQEWGENILLGYSIKTNHLSQIMEIARNEGMIAEAVSDDEYIYALRQGFNKKNIIFNGPQKEEHCLIDALKNGSIVNIDNLEEINLLERHRGDICNINPKVGLRINFDLEKVCKGETTAEKSGSRFGLNIENGEFEEAVNKLIELQVKTSGLHLHYSTKTRSLRVFKKLAEKACEVSKEYGLTDNIRYIDLGGGFWGGRILRGKPTMQEYGQIISETLKQCFNPSEVTLILEPGAALLATAITYYSKVKNIRKIKDVTVVTVDGSLLHINPFFSDRKPDYRIYSSGKKKISKQLICGSTCIEKDYIAQAENEIEMKIGDYIQINNAGAYTMGFNNCFINLPPYIYMKDRNDISLVRNKERDLMLKI